jgi:MoxR-like ATPase
MNLVLAAKARALMEGRYHVTAEDLKKLAPPILRHRVLPNYFAESDGVTIDKILADMLESLPVPAAE